MKHLVSLMLMLTPALSWAELVIYSDRPAARFDQAVKEFTQSTGVSVRFIEAPYPELLKGIESSTSQGDVIITKDLVYLADVKNRGHLTALQSAVAEAKVASVMQDSHWVALTYRVRALAVDPARVSAVGTLSDLANSEWQGRLCLRTSKSPYNTSLVAHLIAVHGMDTTREVLKSWIANLAAPVFANDSAAIEGVVNGTCDLAIVNHYYLAGYLAKNPNQTVRFEMAPVAKSGVHSNGTGIGILKQSKQVELARKFTELLLEERHQLSISAAHFDFPAVKNLQPNTMIKDWGTVTLDTLSWSEIAKQLPAAQTLINEVGYP